MRVALVCPYSLTTPGGVQGQVLGLARALPALGCEVMVFGPTDGPAPPGVTGVGRSLPFRVNGSVAPMAPQPAAAARVVRALRRGRFDVVHLHEPVAPSITIPALLTCRSPLVGTFHAAGDRTPYAAVAWLLRPAAARLDARVAVSEEARDLAARHLGGSYVVLANAVPASEVAAVDAGRAGTRAVLFLGRHEPRKGLEVLLEACAGLDGVEVWVAGDGPLTASLRARHAADRRIRWLGPLTDAEKAARLAAASVLCAPSLHGESFGVVLLEAMAAGTPVVASDLSGYRAAAGHGRAAVLVPPGDPAALAAALVRVLRDPALAQQLTSAGRARAAHHGMDALAARYVELYRAVAVAARGRDGRRGSPAGTAGRPSAGHRPTAHPPVTLSSGRPRP